MPEQRTMMITGIERLDGTEIVVNFSDDTYAIYDVATLLAAAPIRKRADVAIEELPI